LGEENHSMIDLTIEELEVKLSAWWLIEGKGLVKEAVLKGVRGVIDRRTEKPIPNWKPTRLVWQRGDFELVSFSVYDMLITLHYPDPTFRPITVSIFSLQCGLFRRQWLLYDLFHANSIVGVFDGSLFNFGPPQRQKITSNSNEQIMCLKIDGINMDLLSTNASGPLGWIVEGSLDIEMNIIVPIDVPESHDSNYFPHELEDPYHDHSDEVKITFDTHLRLNHIKLKPPLYSGEISWLNNALIHPLSRYMNLHSKHIKLKFRFSVPECNFDGAWSPAEAEIWDAFSEAVYNALILSAEEQRKTTTFKQLLRYIWMLFG